MAPTSTSSPANKRQLPSKESSLFKDLLTHYETRQLKKGQKTADQILKKFPDHGETLCMKGLLLTHMGKREEGLELVKKGIRLDLTSHICWHVFGLIQKGEKNYEEALKSYTQALRFDKDNLNLLSDAANLQTQLRLYDNLLETRQTLLKLRPNLRRNWIALAVSHHLVGDLAGAKRVLESYEKTLKNVPDYDVEHSEVMLYHVRVLEELGEFNEALTLLDSSAKSRTIVDRTSIMEYRARILTKAGNKEEADQAWRALLEHNSDCRDYFYGFLSLKGVNLNALTDDKRKEAMKLLQELSKQLPRSAAAPRLMLDVAHGYEFKKLVRTYILNGLSKGIPSLFVDLKDLYRDPTKQKTIESLALKMVSKYKPADGPQPKKNAATDSPTTYLWAQYFLAQHYSELNRYEEALAILDVAIAHTPTLPELHTCKARVLRRSGDPLRAVKSLEDARKLDGQDRSLNTKSAKYHLRAGLIEEASDILGLFTKKDAASPGADLEEMQSLLYLTEEAAAWQRCGNLGMALKKYKAIQKVFDDFYEDQYDFHSYATRRFTMNSYLNLLSWEDGLKSNPTAVSSAAIMASIYVCLHDDPKLANKAAASSTLTDAQKKAQKKAKKAAVKTLEELKKTNHNNHSSPSSGGEDKGLDPGPAKDDDPDGLKGLKVSDPLEHAWKALKPHLTDECRNIPFWLAVYDVSVRRGKYLQAAKALMKLRSLEAENPELHLRIIDLKQRAKVLGSSSPEAVSAAVALSLKSLLPDELSLETFNSQYLQRNSYSAAGILAAARVSKRLDAPLTEIESLVMTMVSPDVKPDWKACLEAIAFLKSIQSTKCDEFRKACEKRHPLSSVFKTPDETARLKKLIRESPAEDSTDKDYVLV